MASRPTVSVFDGAQGDKPIASVPLPGVFAAPIRPDLVTFVHTQIAKNKRQAHAVDAERAGMQVGAESWGTGRAVARIPRVKGGGTHRAGQGAFGNMCRGGRMFNPSRIWRKWHRKCNVGQRRYAVASAVAATGIPALVMARGHRVSQVPELPLVLNIGDVKQTKVAYDVLARFGVSEDVDKAKESKAVRRGVGKMRNRRYVSRLGPLIVHGEKSATDIQRSFRNLSGVDICSVDSLNLLQLAPGGHMGRLVVWTQDAFEKLDKIYGASLGAVSELKTGFTLPRPSMTTADVARIINSDEVQKVVRPAIDRRTERTLRKKNPITNLGVRVKLNPYAATAIRAEARAQEAAKKAKAEKKRAAPVAGATTKKQRREFIAKLLAE